MTTPQNATAPIPGSMVTTVPNRTLETERWLREMAIVGNPDTVAARIAAPHEELGFGDFMLVTGVLGNLPQPDIVRTLELFAREFMLRIQ